MRKEVKRKYTYHLKIRCTLLNKHALGSAIDQKLEQLQDDDNCDNPIVIELLRQLSDQLRTQKP